MTLDLISRAEARISEINHTIDTLSVERDEIEDAIRTLSRLMESTAPTPLPAGQDQRVAEPVTQEQQPAEAKTVAEASSADDAGGVQDECAIHPAIPSQAKASTGNGATAPGPDIESPADSMSGEASRPASGRSDAATSDDGRDSPERRAPNSNSVSTEPSSPLTEAGEGGSSLPALPGDPSSETPEPVTLIDRIEQKPTLKQMVSACFDEHPDWTAHQIAEGIGRPLTSVQTTLRAVRRERAAQTEPAEHHTLEPADIPAARRPRPAGERFYLRDKDGRFLHQAVTRDRDGAPLFIEKRIYGWFGTEANFQNVLKILPEVAGLRKEVPEK